MGSASDKIAGKAKQAAGKVTGNDKLEGKGKIQETKGKAEGNVDDITEKFPDQP